MNSTFYEFYEFIKFDILINFSYKSSVWGINFDEILSSD
jgi:hypothetical protein